jgi:hypothetical protein
MLINELHTYLFDGQPHILSAPMENWLTSSRRFTAFVTNARDKIRKKIRVTQDPETLLDLRLELETAYRLLQEKSLSLVYEPPCGQGRCPDFAVSFTTSMTFMIEVTRLRTIQIGAVSPESDPLIDAICSKLGQLLPQHSNVLIIGVDVLYLTPTELQSTMLRLQRYAERNDPAFWQRYRFRDRADFFRSYQRLSEILVRGSQLQSAESVIGWTNPQAKYPLPSKVRTALYHSHTV